MNDGDVRTMQRDVLEWYAARGRSFPWREHREPYATLVAEVMLQQTQTSRVIPIYRRFLEQFPEVRSLARAELGDVIRAWQGLGYNRRAVNLHRAAQVIVRDHGGRVPGDVQTLRTLPGLGDYTASAVACVAFDAQVPVVDVNVHRVIARAVHGKQPRDVRPSLVRETAVDLLPRGEAYRWSQALMDLGATLCTSGVPEHSDASSMR